MLPAFYLCTNAVFLLIPAVVVAQPHYPYTPEIVTFPSHVCYSSVHSSRLFIDSDMPICSAIDYRWSPSGIVLANTDTLQGSFFGWSGQLELGYKNKFVGAFENLKKTRKVNLA
jgi:hypothetical protein